MAKFYFLLVLFYYSLSLGCGSSTKTCEKGISFLLFPDIPNSDCVRNPLRLTEEAIDYFAANGNLRTLFVDAFFPATGKWEISVRVQGTCDGGTYDEYYQVKDLEFSLVSQGGGKGVLVRALGPVDLNSVTDQITVTVIVREPCSFYSSPCSSCGGIERNWKATFTSGDKIFTNPTSTGIFSVFMKDESISCSCQ
jgi:hypothetical protein